MRKLDRLAKQLGNIEEIDVRFLRGIKRLTATILQDAKIQIVTSKYVCLFVVMKWRVFFCFDCYALKALSFEIGCYFTAVVC